MAVGFYFQPGRGAGTRARFQTRTHLHVGVVEPQAVGLARLGGVLQRLHDGQEVAAVRHAVVGGGPEASDDLGELSRALLLLRIGDVVP